MGLYMLYRILTVIFALVTVLCLGCAIYFKDLFFTGLTMLNLINTWLVLSETNWYIDFKVRKEYQKGYQLSDM